MIFLVSMLRDRRTGASHFGLSRSMFLWCTLDLKFWNGSSNANFSARKRISNGPVIGSSSSLLICITGISQHTELLKLKLIHIMYYIVSENIDILSNVILHLIYSPTSGSFAHWNERSSSSEYRLRARYFKSMSKFE